MHHTWQGIATSDIIEGIRKRAENSRVVVFTGRDLDITELIQCVRSGVADYWRTSESLDYMITRIGKYCDDHVYSLKNLSLSSATTLQLLERTSEFPSQIEALRGEIAEKQEEIKELTSIENKELLIERAKTIRLAVSFLLVTSCFAGLRVFAGIETTPALICIAIIALFELFFSGRVLSLFFEGMGSKFGVRGNDPASVSKENALNQIAEATVDRSGKK